MEKISKLSLNKVRIYFCRDSTPTKKTYPRPVRERKPRHWWRPRWCRDPWGSRRTRISAWPTRQLVAAASTGPCSPRCPRTSCRRGPVDWRHLVRNIELNLFYKKNVISFGSKKQCKWNCFTSECFLLFDKGFLFVIVQRRTLDSKDLFFCCIKNIISRWKGICLLRILWDDFEE